LAVSTADSLHMETIILGVWLRKVIDLRSGQVFNRPLYAKIRSVVFWITRYMADDTEIVNYVRMKLPGYMKI
jgi:hypothetical protein